MNPTQRLLFWAVLTIAAALFVALAVFVVSPTWAFVDDPEPGELQYPPPWWAEYPESGWSHAVFKVWSQTNVDPNSGFLFWLLHTGNNTVSPDHLNDSYTIELIDQDWAMGCRVEATADNLGSWREWRETPSPGRVTWWQNGWLVRLDPIPSTDWYSGTMEAWANDTTNPAGCEAATTALGGIVGSPGPNGRRLSLGVVAKLVELSVP